MPKLPYAFIIQQVRLYGRFSLDIKRQDIISVAVRQHIGMAKTNSGERVASGVYIYELTTPTFKQTKRLVVIK